MVDVATFDRLRGTYQLSQAIRRDDVIDMRLMSASRPHEGSVPVQPSLEEAYFTTLALMPSAVLLNIAG
jgi:hypothetical protein